MKNFLIFALFYIATFAEAQPINPWLADGINRSIQEGKQVTGRSRYEVDSREAQEIRRLRGMKFYGAIAMSPDNPKALTWGGGDPSESSAREKALKACPKSNCRIISSFSNACAMVALPDGSKGIDNVFVVMDKDPEVAIDKAYRSCEAKFGKGECHYLVREKSAKYTAFCTGYDYGIYSTK